MGVIKSTFQRNPDETSKIMAAHISSFIPSTKNPLLLINEEYKGTISDELVENDQVELLALNQEMIEHTESVEDNEPVESPELVDNHVLTDSILSLLPSSSYQPQNQPLPSPTPLSTVPLPETQLINPNLPSNTKEKPQIIPSPKEAVEA